MTERDFWRDQRLAHLMDKKHLNVYEQSEFRQLLDEEYPDKTHVWYLQLKEWIDNYDR